MDSRISTPRTIPEYVANYDALRAMRVQAYDNLTSADIQSAMFLNGDYDHAKHYSPFQRDKENALKNMLTSSWRQVVTQMRLELFMSLERQRQFEENCEKGTLPPFTLEEIYKFRALILENASGLTQETIDEVYRWIRPGAYRHNPYKTNQKNARWKLGKKIILSSIMQQHYDGKFWVNSYRQKYIKKLDQVFHLIDGNAGSLVDSYTSPLLDMLNTRTTLDKYGETEYFSAACYKNGNLHLTFKRLDLVQKFNQIAGDKNTLGDGYVS